MIGLLKKPLSIYQSGWKEIRKVLPVIRWGPRTSKMLLTEIKLHLQRRALFFKVNVYEFRPSMRFCLVFPLLCVCMCFSLRSNYFPGYFSQIVWSFAKSWNNPFNTEHDQALDLKISLRIPGWAYSIRFCFGLAAFVSCVFSNIVQHCLHFSTHFCVRYFWTKRWWWCITKSTSFV